MIEVTKFIEDQLNQLTPPLAIVSKSQPDWETLQTGEPIVVIQFGVPQVEKSIGNCPIVNTNTLSIKYVGVNNRNLEAEQTNAERIKKALLDLDLPQTSGGSRISSIENVVFDELGTDTVGRFIWEVRAVVTWFSLALI